MAVKRRALGWTAVAGLLAFVAALFVWLLWDAGQDSAAGRLPALGADIGRTTVSGLSSGAYMAGQFQVAHSDVGSSRVDLQACKLEYSIVSPK